MVSRRKILSRSRDNLNSDIYVQEEEDVWYQKEKLFRVSLVCKQEEFVYPEQDTKKRDFLSTKTKAHHRANMSWYKNETLN